MNQKVYFAGSIRGGRSDAALYGRIIAYINQTDMVLTEHIGNVHYSIETGNIPLDRRIYEQDTGWLKECDLVIAECSSPSLGVGYEMAYAEKLLKPVYIFCRKDAFLSAMLTGDPYFHIYFYDTEEDLLTRIDEILAERTRKTEETK